MSTEKIAQEFTTSRTFDAPRALVWKAWTESERMAQWFGPKGSTIIHSNNDPRPGGIYHYGMRAANGHEMWGRWVYREVTEPERLVYLSSFSNPEGDVVPAPFPGDWPLEMLATITFSEPQPGQTTVTVRWIAHNATEAQQKHFAAMFPSMQGGWSGTFDQLDQYLRQAR